MNKELKCIRCGEKASHLVGGADPDMTKSPRCELHALSFRYEVILLAYGNLDAKKAMKLADKMAESELAR